MESELQRIGVSIEEKLLAQFDGLIESKGYTNRLEAIRDLIRERLVEEEWQQDQGESIGTITLVYNHHLREMADRLTDLQHHYHERIISVLHVHLDANNCLEVMGSKRGQSRNSGHCR